MRLHPNPYWLILDPEDKIEGGDISIGKSDFKEIASDLPVSIDVWPPPKGEWSDQMTSDVVGKFAKDYDALVFVRRNPDSMELLRYGPDDQEWVDPSWEYLTLCDPQRNLKRERGHDRSQDSGIWRSLRECGLLGSRTGMPADKVGMLSDFYEQWIRRPIPHYDCKCLSKPSCPKCPKRYPKIGVRT